MKNLWKVTPIKQIMTSANFVGTKCLVAQWANQYRTIGYDVVNTNINDLLSKNAIPDAVTLGISKLNDTKYKHLNELLNGYTTACTESNILSAYGEIATLPDILKEEFPGKTFNVIGFGVGLLDPNMSLHPINQNDLLIGIESNGLHCNGFTLVRRMFLDKWADNNNVFRVGDKFLPTGLKIEEELLRPTFSYKPMIDNLLSNRIKIKGLANVSKGGITSLWNLIAIHNIGFDIDSFPNIPPIFLEIQKRGNVDNEDMFRAFNMGIGFYIVVSNNEKHNILHLIKEVGFKAHIVGKIVESRDIKIHLKNEEIVFKKPYDWAPH